MKAFHRSKKNRGPGIRPFVVEILVLVALAMAPAVLVQADETAPPAEAEVEPTGPEAVPCPELARLKYPFLSCVRGPSGRPVFASEGRGVPGARLKLRGSFASGAGGWGASGIE